jgi:hypothetical protein
MNNELFNALGADKYLELNAALQKKKNGVRFALKEKGVLKREGNNTFDRYKYFSEAQYKILFTELLPIYGLELAFTELSYDTFTGSEKQANGRMPHLRFVLTDAETGFWEETEITGEGMDKGDKAGYKAYTGALKYYLADTFLVATGDDPETESPEAQMNEKVVRKATPKQVEILSRVYTGDNLDKLLKLNGIVKIDDLPMQKASELIGKLKGNG